MKNSISFRASFQTYLSGATKQQIDGVAKALKLSAEEVVKLANAADPTSEKKFEGWILRQMKDSLVRLPEDRERVLQVLNGFVVYSRKRKLKNSDINRYATIHELEEELDELKFDMQVTTPLTEAEIRSYPGVEIINGFDYEGLVLVAVSNVRSLQRFGLGTKWCTRGDYPGSMAAHYLNKARTGKIYILFDPEERDGHEVLIPKYQFEDDFDQFMDAQDRDVFHQLPEDLLLSITGALGDSVLELTLALQRGEYDMLPNLRTVAKDRERAEEAVDNYIQMTLRRGESLAENSLLWLVAIDLGIYSPDLEQEASPYNLGEALTYSVELGENRNENLEGILAVDRFYSEVRGADVLAYFEKYIVPEIQENQRLVEKDPEVWDDEADSDHPKQMVLKWGKIFIRVAEQVKDQEAAEALLNYIQKYMGGEWVEAHDVLKRYPKVWDAYREALKSQGVLIDVFDHFENERKGPK